jgi:predicted transcriptional regulator
LDKARKGKKAKNPHYEVSFDNRKDFERFVKNISILVSIQQLKPKSINELAKLLDKDQSTLNKLILFFEDMGVLTIEEDKVKGRAVKIPKVEYDRIEFRLDAA